MVTVQIYGTNDYLEAQNESVTYIKTSGDLSDISKVNSSYSWSMKFPKSPNNTRVLGGLGLVGSNTSAPYTKIYCNLLDNGFPIVEKGLLNIKETSGDYYSIYIQEGFVDFLRDIKNDTLSDLDLSELDHERNYQVITDSFDLSKPYSYLIADVNGAYLPNESGTTNLKSSFMSPFANAGYIWDLIFDNYGWSYNVNNNTLTSIRDTWMSYPSEVIVSDNLLDEAALLTSENPNTSVINSNGEVVFFKIQNKNQQINNNYLSDLGGQTDYKINVTGTYRIKLYSKGLVEVNYSSQYDVTTTYYTSLFINGVSVVQGLYIKQGKETIFQVNLNKGDIISFGGWSYKIDYGNEESYYDYQLEVIDSVFEVDYLFETGQVSFTKALMKFKVNAFLKEIMTRESLTAFVENENKTINFFTLTERFEQPVTDWTDKFVERKKESYMYNNYAQNNLLKHKYQDELSNYNDGNLIVNNQNLEQEKTLYKSVGYSPNNELTDFTDNNIVYKVPQIPTFEVKTKEDPDTEDVIAEYKFLKDRFFFVKAEKTNNSIYIDNNLANNIPLVSLSGVLFRDIVFDKYNQFVNISSNTKIHSIDLALSLSDVMFLSLSNKYYFEQEASFYLLNKLKYQSGKITNGEFLKIDITKKIEIGAGEPSDTLAGACNAPFWQNIYIESEDLSAGIGDKVFILVSGKYELIDNNDYWISNFDGDVVYRVINGVITNVTTC